MGERQSNESDLITQALQKQRVFSGQSQKSEIRSAGFNKPLLAGKWVGPCQEYRRSLRGLRLGLTASRTASDLILTAKKPQILSSLNEPGSYFSQNLNMRIQFSQNFNFISDIQSRNQQQCLHFWPTELSANKRVLLQATKFMAFRYAATES